MLANAVICSLVIDDWPTRLAFHYRDNLANHNGVITSKEVISLGDLIGEFISRPGVKPFFEENLTVKTESEIITPSGKLLRPDRLVWVDDMLYVIDFKTGIPSDKHKTQMLEYLNVIEQMDYPEPKGVLLYLNQKDPVMVN